MPGASSRPAYFEDCRKRPKRQRGKGFFHEPTPNVFCEALLWCRALPARVLQGVLTAGKKKQSRRALESGAGTCGRVAQEWLHHGESISGVYEQRRDWQPLGKPATQRRVQRLQSARRQHHHRRDRSAEAAGALNSKSQAPSSREAPSIKFQTFAGGRIWCLKFGASLELGIWNLELFAQSFGIGRSAPHGTLYHNKIWNLFTFSAAAGLILSAT